MKFEIIKSHEPIKSLIGVKAGPKNLYLRANRSKILDYLHLNGEAATRSRFYITKQYTWDNFLSQYRRGRPVNKLTRQERYNIRVEMLEETNHQLRTEIRELKEQYNQAIPYIVEQVKEAMFNKLLETISNIPRRLE